MNIRHGHGAGHWAGATNRSRPSPRAYPSREEVETMLAWLTQELPWLLTGEGRRQLDELAATVARYRAEHRAEAEQVDRRLEAIEGKLDGIRAALSRLQDDEYHRHAELSDKWQHLLTGQDLAKAVENAVARSLPYQPDPSAEDHRSRVRAEAELTHRCAKLLVAGEPVDRAELRRLLAVPEGQDGAWDRAVAEKLSGEAEGLHRAASHLKEPPEFDFDAPPAVTQDTAKLYSAECGYGRQVACVVLPAYRVGSRRLSLPTVLTAASSSVSRTAGTASRTSGTARTTGTADRARTAHAAPEDGRIPPSWAHRSRRDRP